MLPRSVIGIFDRFIIFSLPGEEVTLAFTCSLQVGANTFFNSTLTLPVTIGTGDADSYLMKKTRQQQLTRWLKTQSTLAQRWLRLSMLLGLISGMLIVAQRHVNS